MKRWIVTVVDNSETCDGKARVIAVCKTKEAAQEFVKHDLEEYVDDKNYVVDFGKMSVCHSNDSAISGEWNIEECVFD